MTWLRGDYVRFKGHRSSVAYTPPEITIGMLGQIIGVDAIYGDFIIRFNHNQRVYNCRSDQLLPVGEREAMTEIAANLLGVENE